MYGTRRITPFTTSGKSSSGSCGCDVPDV